MPSSSHCNYDLEQISCKFVGKFVRNVLQISLSSGGGVNWDINPTVEFATADHCLFPVSNYERHISNRESGTIFKKTRNYRPHNVTQRLLL